MFAIGSQPLTLDIIDQLILQKTKLKIDPVAHQKIINSRNYLDKKLENNNQLFYGINTGFGSLCNVAIQPNELEDLQYKLVVSTACGVGDHVPPEIVKILLLLKIQALSYGYSGITIQVVQFLIELYNNDLLPIIYTQGSLGASGDLAPLAHMALTILGIGQVNFKGTIMDATEALNQIGLKPIVLKSKEGLALLNGTQFMCAYAVWCLLFSKKLSHQADFIGACSIDAFSAKTEPFSPVIHQIRPHQGQIQTAKTILSFLQDSEIANQHKVQVQDPYSFRCIPQVHGATKDAIKHVQMIVETEINSVTDNPIIDVDNDQILSGGNFHGQPLAINLDYLAIAMAELANISERRTYQLLSGERNLPVFLVSKPGLNCGLMIPQYTAASLVSQNKQLATPASVDSIVSCNGQEDHVSMGANSATKCLTILHNTQKVLAIELLTAMQALDFRQPLQSSPIIQKVKNQYRQSIQFIDQDRVFYIDILESISFLNNLNI